MSSNLIEESLLWLAEPSGKSCRTERAVTDFPDPDSPTRERVFPLSIAKEISALTKNKKIISVAGGGDTVAALSQSNYNKDFTYISTAGGAFLELLSGEKLPGLEVLRK